METTQSPFKIELTKKQSEAWHLLMSDEKSISLLYGGAKGGGKSFFLCVWVYAYAKKLIDILKIESKGQPIAIGFMGRKRSVDFANTTLRTWRRVIPKERYTIREQAKEIIIDEKVIVSYGGLDDQEAVNKFNSAEFVFFAIDQAEETDKSDVSVLEGSLRLKVNGIQPPYRKLLTANPAECWLKNEYAISKNSPTIKGNYYIPALYTDNKYLPDNYAETLEKAFSYDVALLTAYKEGDWSLAHDSDYVITRTMLEKLKEKTVYDKEDSYTAGLDPAIGGDECVAYVLRNGKCIAEKISHETNPMIIAGDFVAFCNANIPLEYRHCAKKYGFDYAGVDSCGLGVGIAQRCKDLGLSVRFINSSHAATDERCFLVRDEVWLYLREEIQKCNIPPVEDYAIIEQITAFKFKNRSGKFKVVPKDVIKSAIGCSPDRGDAFAYAQYMRKFAKTIKDIEKEKYTAYDYTDYDWRTA